MREAALKKAAMVACAVLLALVLRAPLVSSNSRYFYHEDDAHHFNRTVEMAQRFDLNPSYFNKPALHFYLRMPVVWASAVIVLAGWITGGVMAKMGYGVQGPRYAPKAHD